MGKTEMENTVSLVTGSALSDFQRNPQRKTSVFKHHSTPPCRQGAWAPQSRSFLISLWEQWVCFKACSRMPVIFHLWTSWTDTSLNRSDKGNQGSTASNLMKYVHLETLGTKPVRTMTRIIECLLYARHIHRWYNLIPSLWGRDLYLHFIEEEARVQQG